MFLPHNFYPMSCIFSGNEDAVEQKLQRCRRSMDEVLSLQDIPEVEQETEELKHMRIHKLVSFLMIFL